MKAFLLIGTSLVTGLVLLILLMLGAGAVSSADTRSGVSEILVESWEHSHSHTHSQAGGNSTATITHTYSIDQCCGTPGTQQSSQLDFRVVLTTTEVLRMQYFVSPLHCSDVRLHILVDDQEVFLTEFMGPLGGVMTTGVLDLGPISSGNHSLTLAPEGKTGGCNTGTLHRWHGTLVVNVSEPPACSVPFFTQIDDNWKNYPLRGTCSGWCIDPQTGYVTIGRCGCTLTSATMVFNTFGAGTNPKELSDCKGSSACPFTWTTNCSDNVVSKISRPSWNDLSGWNTLDQQLNQNHRPIILGMHKKGDYDNTYWVVVVSGQGSNPNDYRMHDPAFKCGANLSLGARSKDYDFDYLGIYEGQVACSSLTALTPSCVGRGANPEPIARSGYRTLLYDDKLAAPLSVISGTAWIYSMTEITMTVEITGSSSVGNLTEMRIWSDSMPDTAWQQYTPFVWLPVSDIVYARFRDDLGNATDVYSDTIHPKGPPTAPLQFFLPLFMRR